MCETVLEYFKAIHVASDIRDGASYWNPKTGEEIYYDKDYDEPPATLERGCGKYTFCISQLGGNESMTYEERFEASWCDTDIDREEAALRIVTEEGWVRR